MAAAKNINKENKEMNLFYFGKERKTPSRKEVEAARAAKRAAENQAALAAFDAKKAKKAAKAAEKAANDLLRKEEALNKAVIGLAAKMMR